MQLEGMLTLLHGLMKRVNQRVEMRRKAQLNSHSVHGTHVGVQMKYLRKGSAWKSCTGMSSRLQ